MFLTIILLISISDRFQFVQLSYRIWKCGFFGGKQRNENALNVRVRHLSLNVMMMMMMPEVKKKFQSPLNFVAADFTIKAH